MQKTLLSCTVVLLLGFSALALLSVAGARINTTKSIPVGLYWVSKESVAKGAYVMFCPPPLPVFDLAKERGYIAPGSCPGGYGYLMKKILAAKNDVICCNEKGVFVNDILLPFSTPLASDPSGRPLPLFRTDSYTLGLNETLLMSDVSATSFDGRYYGPISVSQIKTVIRPVVTW